MTGINFWELVVFLAILTALTPVLGRYMKRVFTGEKTLLDAVLRPLERGIYRTCGVDASRDQHWTEWTLTMLMVNAVSLAALYAVQRLQKLLPLNPNGLGAVSADSSWNTAVSFTSNTNWQGYSGESTMSSPHPDGGPHAAQLPVGGDRHRHRPRGHSRPLAVSGLPASETSGSTAPGQSCGCCCRSRSSRPSSSSRSGVVQNFLPDVTVQTVEGATQRIAQGPVASQVAIKMLGTNGGGFFNANSAHPYENPTPLVNFFRCSPSSYPGRADLYLRQDGRKHATGMGDFRRHGVLFLVGVFVAYARNSGETRIQLVAGLRRARRHAIGGNMEGKETRFGIANSALFATVTTAASCGAVNSMHDCYTPRRTGSARQHHDGEVISAAWARASTEC